MSTAVVAPTEAAPSERFPGGRIFAVLALLYVVAFLPALRHAWWFRDDYLVGELSADDLRRTAYSTGRPVYGLLFRTIALDNRADAVTANVLLRLGRALLHVTACWVLALLLWRKLRAPRVACLATLPFLLWFLNPDAVLARLGAGYPLAVLLTLTALLSAECGHRFGWGQVAAIPLAALAVLSNQAAAMGGVVVWVLLPALEAAAGRRPDVRLALRQGLPLLLGLLLGAYLSVRCIHHFPETAAPDRQGFATDWRAKMVFWWDLQQCFFLYPRERFGVPSSLVSRGLNAAQIALCVGSFGWLLYRGVGGRPWLLAAAATLPLLTVLPYFALLVVRESWPSCRAMYLAPLLLTGAAALGYQATRRCPVPLILGGLALVVIVCGNVRLARTNAADYLETQRRDLETLEQVKAAAREQGCRRVVLLTDEVVRDWNPYHVHFLNADNHPSAFLIGYGAPYFVRRHSDLEVVWDLALKEQARRQIAASPRPPGFHFERLAGTDVLIVCPP
jgi:hypothetical protein